MDTDHLDRVTIHSPRLNCYAYLLELLNAAVWLAERVKIGAHRNGLIEIRLSPVGSPWIGWARALSNPSRLAAVAGRLVRRSWHWANGSGSGAARAEVSLVERIRRRSSDVRIQIDDRLAVQIRPSEPGYLGSTPDTIRACFKALPLWRNCCRNGRLNRQAFLVSRYSDVQIGDLVASEMLASQPSAGGSLQRCSKMALWWRLVDAIYTVDYILRYGRELRGSHYVATCETTYLEELYRRVLRQQGVHVLELYDYSGKLSTVGPQEEWLNPFIARPWQGGMLSDDHRERAQRYLSERVSDAGRHLWYMYVGRNRSGKDSIMDESGRTIERDERTLTVIIFLHSFEDAQYWYGHDGFDDLYEWTEVSIDECLKNEAIGRVLIKEHPNVDPERFPGDKQAVQTLKERYSGEPKVFFVGRYANLKTLAGLGVVYGITNYGSVAEELVSIGVPVVASTKAPWEKSYPFPRLWDSPEEYRTLLRSLSIANWYPPTVEEIEALHRFVNEYRLNVSPGQDLPVSVQWLQWKDKTIDILARDISEKAEQEIAGLQADSPDLIEWLRDRARWYQGSQKMKPPPRVISEFGSDVLQQNSSFACQS